MLRPRHRILEARVVGQARLLHRHSKAPENSIAHRSNVDVAVVTGRIKIVRRALRQARACAHGDMPQFLMRRDPGFHEAESTFVERRIDALATPRAVSGQQRHAGAKRGIESGDVVGHRHGNARRRAVRVSGQMPQTTDRLADDAISSPLAVGARLAEAADSHHHQAGVALGKFRITQAPILQSARAEVLDQHIALGRQLGHQRLAFRLAQVNRGELLVPEDAGGIERLALKALAHGPDRVAFGGLDLDDLGAKIGQQASAERAGDRGADLEHAHARKRANAAINSGRSSRGGGGLAHWLRAKAGIFDSASGSPWHCAYCCGADVRPLQHHLDASLPAPPGALASPPWHGPAG